MSAVAYPSTAEYDAFGPWIDPVTTAAEVPRLYRDVAIDFAAAHTVLKFPRAIARRDATPQMHLYDHLVIANPESLDLLSREGETFSTASIRYDRIASVTDGITMLDARLRIRTLDGGEHSLQYNGSSQETVTGLVALLRSLALATVAEGALRAADSDRARKPVAALGLDDLGRGDAVFVTWSRELLRKEPGLRLLSAQGRQRVTTHGSALLGLLDLVNPANLHALVVLGTDDELQILHRGHLVARGGAPIVSRARTVVPLAGVDSVTRTPHPRYADVDVVTLRSGSSAVEVLVAAGSDAERVLLAQLPRSRRR
jgi:hypothetical protein